MSSMNMGFVYAFGAAITWGLVYVIDQKILHNTSPMALLFVGSLATAIIMLPVIIFDRDPIRSLLASGSANLWLILLSLFLVIAANFFSLTAIKTLGAHNVFSLDLS